MSSIISTWLSKYDQFGTYAKFTYHGEAGFGTGVGGCCSLFITCNVAIFVFLQLWAFIYLPQWNNGYTINYLDSSLGHEVLPYTITAGDFIPTFNLVTRSKNQETGELEKVFNDETKFRYYYTQKNMDLPKEDWEQIEAINCVDYIDGPYWEDLSEVERSNAKGQLVMPETQLCPNVPFFILEGGLLGQKSFSFNVEALPGTSSKDIDNSEVL